MHGWYRFFQVNPWGKELISMKSLCVVYGEEIKQLYVPFAEIRAYQQRHATLFPSGRHQNHSQYVRTSPFPATKLFSG